MSEQLSPAVRIVGAITKAGTFTVQSATDPDSFWVVEWINAHSKWCGCPAFTKASNCRHVRAVFAAIEQEWQQRRLQESEARKERVAS